MVARATATCVGLALAAGAEVDDGLLAAGATAVARLMVFVLAVASTAGELVAEPAVWATAWVDVRLGVG